MYTPKHTSWLNQIEFWFSILVRRLLKRGNFASVEDLRQRILAFIAYFNPSCHLLNGCPSHTDEFPTAFQRILTFHNTLNVMFLK